MQSLIIVKCYQHCATHADSLQSALTTGSARTSATCASCSGQRRSACTSTPSCCWLGTCAHGGCTPCCITVGRHPQTLTRKGVVCHVPWVLLICKKLFHHILCIRVGLARTELTHAIVGSRQANSGKVVAGQVPGTHHGRGVAQAARSCARDGRLVALRVADERPRPMEQVIHPCAWACWLPSWAGTAAPASLSPSHTATYTARRRVAGEAPWRDPTPCAAWGSCAELLRKAHRTIVSCVISFFSCRLHRHLEEGLWCVLRRAHARLGHSKGCEWCPVTSPCSRLNGTGSQAGCARQLRRLCVSIKGSWQGIRSCSTNALQTGKLSAISNWVFVVRVNGVYLLFITNGRFEEIRAKKMIVFCFVTGGIGPVKIVQCRH